jgi:prepilin-type N-terminal cleavage/methylation domain-containing protein
MRRQDGFTLIEIAIVLVIIGLLLGGVLKGQELITGARVRNIIQQQDGVKAAYFGFLDRYRALPGDYSNAVATITGVTGGGVCGTATFGNGNGNGQIELAGTPASASENVLAWEHLSKAGFINGTYTCNTTVSAATSPSNPYGQYLNLIYDATYAVPSGTATARHNLKTGGSIPSDLLGEIDRKVDDGIAWSGSFRSMTAGTGVTAASCYDATATTGTGVWVSTPGFPSCGGATIF